MDHAGSKTKSLGQILEKPCVCSSGQIFNPIIMEPSQIVCLDEISDEFENGHVGSKTRSLCHILEKPCMHSRGHIFSPIIMKLGQNICLYKTSDKFENRSCWITTHITRSNLRKTLCTFQRPYFQSDCHET